MASEKSTEPAGSGKVDLGPQAKKKTMVDKSEERPLFIAPSDIEVAITPMHTLSVHLGHPHKSLGFAAEIVLARELSPSEARQIAALLVRKADEAEVGLPRAQYQKTPSMAFVYALPIKAL